MPSGITTEWLYHNGGHLNTGKAWLGNWPWNQHFEWYMFFVGQQMPYGRERNKSI